MTQDTEQSAKSPKFNPFLKGGLGQLSKHEAESVQHRLRLRLGLLLLGFDPAC